VKTIGEISIERGARPETCAVHGAYESINVFGRVWSRCPSCAKEAKELDELKAEEARRAAAKRSWEDLIGRAGIPERFRTRTLDTYETDGHAGKARALDFAKRYADGFEAAPGRGAVFVGKPGTGKTHLAIGIALELMQRGRMALFVTALQAIRSIKDSWRRDSTMSETQAIAVLTRPDLLILDEIGVQFGSEAEKLLLFEVLNERYVSGRATLLLSNLTTDEIGQYLGERVMDRLREDGARVMPFAWESYRANRKLIGI
jgi:DNA replication protein DnaC